MTIFFSYAQNFEDVLLWRCLRDVEDGFYIDVGAWDPDFDSVTRAFSDRGWHGINVEPALAPFLKLRERRPRDINLAVALGAEPGTADFFDIAGTGLSTTDAALARQHEASGLQPVPRSVPVTTLAELCRQHAPAQIHFLKIDCEGSEAAVIAGADFGLFRPWIVLVEATVPNSPEQNHHAWEPSLLSAAYRFAWFDGLNRFYVADEHAEALVPKLQLPPNVFDRFVRTADVPATPAPPPSLAAPTAPDPLLDVAVTLSLDARIALAGTCRDCDDVPKVASAGQVLPLPDGTRVQIMHNGLKVLADGYCGPWMTELIRLCRGHHEPQEERLFHVAARCLPADATMIELGGNWAYYSAWFLQGAPGRRAVVLEPDPANRAVGEHTMRLNGLSATFVAGSAGAVGTPPAAFATERSGILDLPCYAVPDLMVAHGIERLDLLHCDTQGAELAVLTGCGELLRSGRIGFVFVSTHVHQISGDPLTHQRCLRLLQECGAVIEAEHDAHESFSGDGLIVARFGPAPPGWRAVRITLARRSDALFRDLAYDLAALRAVAQGRGPVAAPTIVNDVFAALLFRAPDPMGLASFVELIGRSGSTAQLLQIVLTSPEFLRQRQLFASRYFGGVPGEDVSGWLVPPMPDSGPFGCTMLDLVLKRDAPLGRVGDTLAVPNDRVMLPMVAAAGAWSAEHVDFMAERADPAHRYLVLDVGANVGLFSRQLLQRCGNIAVCCCIEPDPVNFEALRRNVTAKPGTEVQTHNVALGATDGKAAFYRDEANCGNYSLLADAVRGRRFSTAEVTVAAAGPWLEQHAGGEHPILWKSDTQGSDEEIVAAVPWPIWRRVAAAVIELWRIRKERGTLDAFYARVADMPNCRIGDRPASAADVQAYLAGDDQAHEDLYLWR